VAVLLACPGLDSTRRGFETFARECFEAFRGHPEIDMQLAKGSGPRRDAETVIPALKREGRAARALARLLRREPFVIEHVAFSLALIPRLLRDKPDVVYFSEWHVGRVLAAWRRATRQRVALVFCNGGLVASGYEKVDVVQQLVPGAIEFTLERGASADNQILLPLGVAMERSAPPNDSARAELRRGLGLPADRLVVMSAGALGYQKGMDRLIDEVGSMSEPRPFLLLAGQEEAETPAIRALAQERLGPDGHEIRTVAPQAMSDHYRASDAFVLASLWESFGKVLVEAQSHGLPCLAHDYPVMSWILGDEGDTRDLSHAGAIAAWLGGLSEADFAQERRLGRQRSASERFSWGALLPRYGSMLRPAADRRRPA
jgi:1,2-diacylglycerol 3-alpha-glucosyltransferase